MCAAYDSSFEFADDVPDPGSVSPNQPMPWVDKLICARKPTYDVLEEFGMIVRKSNANPDAVVASPHPQPAVLETAAVNLMYDSEYAVHPQISHMLLLSNGEYFGAYIPPSQLLAHMRRLVLNREDPAGYSNPKRGPQEHGPHPNSRNPDPTCTRGCPQCKKKADGVTCKANFPFQANAHTHMGENGFVVYKRASGDEFIVPYNPWLTLEFEAHVNVEYAATQNCIAYLYKYLFKGSRGERTKFGFRQVWWLLGKSERHSESRSLAHLCLPPGCVTTNLETLTIAVSFFSGGRTTTWRKTK